MLRPRVISVLGLAVLAVVVGQLLAKSPMSRSRLMGLRLDGDWHHVWDRVISKRVYNRWDNRRYRRAAYLNTESGELQISFHNTRETRFLFRLQVFPDLSAKGKVSVSFWELGRHMRFPKPVPVTGTIYPSEKRIRLRTRYWYHSPAPGRQKKSKDTMMEWEIRR